jgi:hypothetical protein
MRVAKKEHISFDQPILKATGVQQFLPFQFELQVPIKAVLDKILLDPNLALPQHDPTTRIDPALTLAKVPFGPRQLLRPIANILLNVQNPHIIPARQHYSLHESDFRLFD